MCGLMGCLGRDLGEPGWVDEVSVPAATAWVLLGAGPRLGGGGRLGGAPGLGGRGLSGLWIVGTSEDYVLLYVTIICCI